MIKNFNSILKLKIESTNLKQLTLYLNKYLLKRFILLTLISLPTKIFKNTLLKSPHINKKSREQFEIKIFRKVCYIKFQKQNIKKYFYLLLKTLPATCTIRFYI